MLGHYPGYFTTDIVALYGKIVNVKEEKHEAQKKIDLFG